MRLTARIGEILGLLFRPIRDNAVFFVFMFLLGWACLVIEAPDPKIIKPYPFSIHELFADLYVVCALLLLLPRKVRRWVRGVVSTLLYIVSVADVYCFVKFDTMLSPSVLMLVGETTGGEAAGFIDSCLTWDVVVASPLGWLFLIMLAHVACAAAPVLLRRIRHLPRLNAAVRGRLERWCQPVAGVVTAVLFLMCAVEVWPNKKAMVRLMSQGTVGALEADMKRADAATMYLPLYRLAFSINANRLTAKQLDRLIGQTDHLQVDSCSFRSPNIVLIIGESYNRHHSQLYGYDKPTTPRQLARAKRGDLTVFDDVVAPWNLTSFVFKHLMSLYTVGDHGDWCDYPLFPELFRKAGYHVTFITNQFLQQTKEEIYDFSGGFFLNNEVLSAAQFDSRNTRLHRFDEGLLDDYDSLRHERTDANLTIFHLYGQHMSYKDRCPQKRKIFGPDDYDRPDLNRRDRWVIGDYDNATLYNDSVVDAIVSRFEHEDAIVIYLSDHGEECYWGVRNFGRIHSDNIDRRLAHEEYEVPFWIWCSRSYAAARPDIVADIKAARNRPFMTDRLGHLLLYLAGISSPDYRPDCNLIGPEYDETRPRILKNRADYDKLREENGE